MCCSTADEVCIANVCSPKGGPGDECDDGEDSDCQDGLTCCSGICRDLDTDPDFCGDCESSCDEPDPNNCEGARTCTGGICGFDPADDETLCRPADASGCDVDDFCDGVSLGCPTDEKQTNETICGTNQICCDGVCCAANAFCSPGGLCVECLTAATCPTPSNQCHVATCSGGACGEANKGDGVACNDGDACTQTDTCQTGECVGSNPVECDPPDQCHLPGTCNPGSGTCSYAAKPNDTLCDDDDACTQTDTCQEGVCVGSDPVVCTALDQCHGVGECNPATGACSNPVLTGSPCTDGNLCTTVDTCQADGTCVGTPVTCSTAACLSCNPGTGTCDTICTAGTSCNGAGDCVADCAGAGLACTVPGTPSNCCSGLVCNENSVCEAPCDPENPTANCICSADVDNCPITAACCLSAGNSTRRCSDSNGNCACTSNATCADIQGNFVCCVENGECGPDNSGCTPV